MKRMGVGRTAVWAVVKVVSAVFKGPWSAQSTGDRDGELLGVESIANKGYRSSTRYDRSYIKCLNSF